MNNELKFQVGDVWKMCTDKHNTLKYGDYFEVVSVGFSAALTSQGYIVSVARIHDGEVKLIERNKPFVHPCFTKDMLESGKHVVEYRDGEKRLVFNDTLTSANSGIPLSSYNHQLLHKEFPDLDIVKVYKLNSAIYGLNRILNESNELIWKRQEPSAEQLELQKLEEQMRELADKIAVLRAKTKP
jgi:hypothetical protein